MTNSMSCIFFWSRGKQIRLPVGPRNEIFAGYLLEIQRTGDCRGGKNRGSGTCLDSHRCKDVIRSHPVAGLGIWRS